MKHKSDPTCSIFKTGFGGYLRKGVRVCVEVKCVRRLLCSSSDIMSGLRQTQKTMCNFCTKAPDCWVLQSVQWGSRPPQLFSLTHTTLRNTQVSLDDGNKIKDDALITFLRHLNKFCCRVKGSGRLDKSLSEPAGHLNRKPGSCANLYPRKWPSTQDIHRKLEATCAATHKKTPES